VLGDIRPGYARSKESVGNRYSRSCIKFAIRQRLWPRSSTTDGLWKNRIGRPSKLVIDKPSDGDNSAQSVFHGVATTSTQSKRAFELPDSRCWSWIVNSLAVVLRTKMIKFPRHVLDRRKKIPRALLVSCKSVKNASELHIARPAWSTATVTICVAADREL